MLELGASDNHGNGHEFGDIQDQTGDFSVALFMIKRATQAAVRDMIYKNSAGGGWAVRVTAGGLMSLNINGTGAQANSGPSLDTLQSWVAGFDTDGNTVAWFLDAVADGTPAQAANPANAAGNFAVGCTDGAANGYACRLGQVMVWTGATLGLADAQQYHAGDSIPQRGTLTFWHKGTATPGVDDVGGTTPTVNGTVTLHSNAVDTYFQEPGGFAAFAAHWIPLLWPAAGLFGSYLRGHLRSSRLPALWLDLQRLTRCRIVGATEAEVVSVFDMLRRRPHFVFGGQ